MADVTVGAGRDELMVLRDDDIDGEEAAEMDDGNPAHDQSEHKQDEPNEIRCLRVRQLALRQRGAEKKAAKMLAPLTVQWNGSVKRSFLVARNLERSAKTRATSEASSTALRTFNLGSSMTSRRDQRSRLQLRPRRSATVQRNVSSAARGERSYCRSPTSVRGICGIPSGSRRGR